MIVRAAAANNSRNDNPGFWKAVQKILTFKHPISANKNLACFKKVHRMSYNLSWCRIRRFGRGLASTSAAEDRGAINFSLPPPNRVICISQEGMQHDEPFGSTASHLQLNSSS